MPFRIVWWFVKLPIKAVGNFATGMTRLVVFVVIVLVILFFIF